MAFFIFFLIYKTYKTIINILNKESYFTFSQHSLVVIMNTKRALKFASHLTLETVLVIATVFISINIFNPTWQAHELFGYALISGMVVTMLAAFETIVCVQNITEFFDENE